LAAFFVYGSVVASITLAFNCAAMARKIKADQDPFFNTLACGLSLAFIVYSIFGLCGR